MFGETYANTNPPATAKWGGPFTYSWMAGPLMTAYGLPSNPNPSTDPPGWNYFSSRHTGVVNFALGDASVRPIRAGATSGSTYNTFVYMSGMREGAVIDPSTL